MKVRSLRLPVFLLILCVTFAHDARVSTPAMGQSPAEFPEQDGMLDEHMSPDDDGDHVPDLHDSHPNDPTRGTNPRPGPTDPIADDDGDGLPNVMDPDDNNNGISDAEEGVSAGGRPPEPVPDRTPTPGSRERTPSVQGGSLGQASLVRALPSTGASPDDTASLVLVLSVISVSLLAASQVSRRTIRP